MEGLSGTPSRGHELDRIAADIIDAVLDAADPGAAVERGWIEPGPGPVFLAAFGKASIGMADAAASILGARVSGGIVLAVPERAAAAALPASVGVFEVDHPLPTERNVVAARALAAGIEAFARSHADGTVVCLISGGGSAHATLPAHGLSLDDLRAVHAALQRAGAPIEDLNAVRKHTEALKGGRLAMLGAPLPVIALVISDVIGDRLDVIASGPTVADLTTFADALEALDRWGCRGAAPAVGAVLERGRRSELEETPKPGAPALARVRTRVVASNREAVIAASGVVARAGFRVIPGVGPLTGFASDGARALAARMAAEPGADACALVVGHETTVDVGAGGGLGGPSQELGLALAVELERTVPRGRYGIVAFSSDGIDGPTDAAGAVLAPGDLARARREGHDPGAALARHDSHAFLGRAGCLIRTGPTGTNVNHIAAVLRLA